jgi:hypothetical protein
MLERSFAQVLFISDGPQHLAGVNRPEFPNANLADAVADVIVPDFPVSLLRGSACFAFNERQVDVLDKLLQG